MNENIMRELSALSDVAEGGLLKAESVVEYAQANPDSALHQEFEWDDKTAAGKYRVQQARELIRGYVIQLPQNLHRIRGFVSVPSDRTNGGGYRKTEDVLKVDAMRLQMIEDNLKRLENMRTSATILPELQPFYAQLSILIAEFRAQRLGIAKAA